MKKQKSTGLYRFKNQLWIKIQSMQSDKQKEGSLYRPSTLSDSKHYLIGKKVEDIFTST